MLERFKSHIQGGIVFVAGIVFAVLVSEFLEAKALNTSAIFYFLLIGFLLLIVYYVGQINSEVQSMVISLGTRVRYVGSQWETESTRSGDVFEEVRQIIERAEYEILIASHNDPYFDPNLYDEEAVFEDPAQQKRLDYLRAIERKLESVRDRPFEYTRIIQLPHPEDVHLSELTLGPVEFNHCRNVLQLKQSSRNANLVVNILKMRTERTLTFLIVDGKYFILADMGIRYTGEGKASYVAGVFIVEDFNGSLVGGFRRYFLGHLVPSARPLTLKDFTSTGYPTAL